MAGRAVPWNQICTLPSDPCWTFTKMLRAPHVPLLKTTQHPSAPVAPSENKSSGEERGEKDKVRQRERLNCEEEREEEAVNESTRGGKKKRTSAQERRKEEGEKKGERGRNAACMDSRVDKCEHVES